MLMMLIFARFGRTEMGILEGRKCALKWIKMVILAFEMNTSVLLGRETYATSMIYT
jgi:hypothetical protein